MIATEFEEELERLKDAELLRLTVKYLKQANLELERAGGDDEAQEYLDFIFMECSRRGKEWIFDKAQDACMRSIEAKADIEEVEEEAEYAESEAY